MTIEKIIAENYKQSYNFINSELVKLSTKVEELTYSNAIKFNRLDKLKLNIKKEIENMTGSVLVDIDAERVNQFKKKYKDDLLDAEKVVGTKLFTELPTQTIKSFILAVPYSGLTLSETIQDLSTETIKRLNRSITQGLIRGSGIRKIAQSIKEQTDISYRRALTISRTETLRAYSLGNEESYKRLTDLGLETEKEWIHVSASKNPRDMHISMNGKKSVEGRFVLPDGTQTNGPRLTGTAKHDINCHCVVRNVILNS